MPKFSKTSLKHLKTCDERLQLIMNHAINIVDFSIICGHRDKQTQDSLFKQGKSMVKWPNSKHNSLPSKAIDIIPYPVNWNDFVAFENLAKIIKDTAKYYDIGIEWGGDWKHFKDYPHFQLT